jgi:hypothetical protein
VFRAFEKEARDSLTAGRRHLFEAGLKEQRRTHGQAAHEAGPPPSEPGQRRPTG